MQTATQRQGASSSDDGESFLSSVAAIRRRARSHINDSRSDSGAAAGTDAGSSADRESVVRLLKTALATEMLCVKRYRRYGEQGAPQLADTLRDQFRLRALEEQAHSEKIAARIIELGGEPDPDPPTTLSAEARSEYRAAPYDQDDEQAEGENLADMLAEDLIVERIAIDTYREIIGYVGDRDAATRRLFECIVTAEQQHAADLASVRENIQRQSRASASAHHAGGAGEQAAAQAR